MRHITKIVTCAKMKSCTRYYLITGQVGMEIVAALLLVIVILAVTIGCIVKKKKTKTETASFGYKALPQLDLGLGKQKY